MLFILSLVLAFAFAFLCKQPLKKQPYIFYALAVIISAVISFANFRGLPPAVNTYVLGLFTRGAFATGLWCVVMWTGAFPNGSKPMKALMPVRGELSIFAALLTFGHNIGFGRTYFVRLFTDAGKMSSAQVTASVLTLIMLAIMIPLTVLSFPKIRKKMKASTWKKIQRTAYIFYALLYIHVMTLFTPMAKLGRDGYFLSIIVYSAVFISYAVCRIRKAYVQSCKREKKTVNAVPVNVLCSGAFVLAMIFPCMNAKQAVQNTNIPAGETVKTSVTTAALKQNVTEEVTTVSGTQTSAAVTTVTGTGTTVSGTGTTAVTTTVSGDQTTVTGETSQTEQSEENKEEQKPEEQNNDQPQEEHHQDQPVQETPPPAPEQPEETPAPEPEIQYVYNNGTYSASAYGYDGDVTVTVTIENDVIISISGSTAEIDDAYFNDAKDYVFNQIMGGTNPNVDAYSGSTYSSKAIMSAVAQCLDQARR